MQSYIRVYETDLLSATRSSGDQRMEPQELRSTVGLWTVAPTVQERLPTRCHLLWYENRQNSISEEPPPSVVLYAEKPVIIQEQ